MTDFVRRYVLKATFSDQSGGAPLVFSLAPVFAKRYALKAEFSDEKGGAPLEFSLAHFYKGDKGAIPSHTWTGTGLSFQKPDGTFDAPVELKGQSGDSNMYWQSSNW